MKVLVINGSPKGDYSTTLQTVKYLEILFPGHCFEYINAGAQIRLFENDMTLALQALESADLLIFSYPVYTFLVPSQLHRFIELIKTSGIDLRGKFATQITTSKHFYDTTAHAFICENCMDLGMKYIKGLSADMDDLTMESGRKDAESFFRYALWCVENDIYEPLPPAAAPSPKFPVAVPEDQGRKLGDVVIVADLAPEDSQLRNMIRRFRAVFSRKTRVVNIHDFEFKGGCLSCFNCVSDGECIYKDGFTDLLRNEIQTAEAIVIAFTVKDHSMGSVFKTYDDRQFCNGHRTVTMGMPFGYLVSGSLSRESNLRQVIEARAEVGGNFLAGVATDEFDPNRDIDSLAIRLAYAVENKYTQPSGFYGVGGRKIFRDLIWLMRGLMKADHKFFKAHDQYDFPQKQFGKSVAMYFAGSLIANKKLKAKMGKQINEGMIRPYRKVLKAAKRRAAQKKS